ncbi:bacterial Ig-like domain-containing protein [Erysipelothrix piscisicarius]|uniref:bacterial Ig-like domain-containing protein n=1 Tax=Erysipelothrix piscisicarius TaxID=2485784 RepID=UPI000F63D531|nr:bacterial Ig-like domain-containing protein [Erysipelothrix piscisicarius]
MNFKNYSDSPVSNLTSVFSLPRIGYKTLTEGKDRGSEFDIYLKEKITVPSNFKAYYTTETLDEDLEASVHNSSIWSESVTDYAAVTAVKLVMESGSLDNGKEYVINYKGTSGSQEQYKGIAYSSVAFSLDDGAKTFTESELLGMKAYYEMGIHAHDSTIYVGDSWTAEDNFDLAVDENGDMIPFADLTVDDSEVIITKPGNYPVVYKYLDMEKTVTVTVKNNEQSITGSDVTKYVGDAMPSDSEFNASATDKDGGVITVTLDKGAVDMSIPGDYDVVITATDGQTKTVKVHVKEDKHSINGIDLIRYTGDALPSIAEFKATAMDKDGNPLEVTLDTSSVDMTTTGTYSVVITASDGQTKTVSLEIRENKQSLVGSDVTKYVGDTLPQDTEFMVSATDKEGNIISVTVDTSKVDMSKAGTYDVVLKAEDGQLLTVKVIVKANLQSINGIDVAKNIGDALPEKGEFMASATDRDGNPIDVTIDTSKVGMNTPGKYEVVITSTDGQTLTVFVTVTGLVLDGTVTIIYIDSNGNVIHEQRIITGQVGDAYSTEALNLKGYTLKEIRGNATGLFTEENQTVTYVYTKDENGNQLPQTGVSTPLISFVKYLGAVLIVMGGGLVYKNRKKSKIER